MRPVSKLVLFSLSIFAVLLLTVSFAQAQAATQPAGSPVATQPAEAPAATEIATPPVEGSGIQLKLQRPLLGMQLMDASDAPDFYKGLTLGGGDLFIALGGACVSGYTDSLASLGLVLIADSGPVEVGFNSADSSPTAIVLWDQTHQQWWCSQSFGQGAYLQFQNVTQGIYFVWVLTQTNQTVQGDVFVRAVPAQ